jgi:MarR family transcriptional regulator, negative regulator of the multidrug operon emrRAB
MNEENVANLLGALATMVTDGIVDAVARTPDMVGEQTALALLAKYSDCSIQELRDPLGLSHSGCVRLVDRLVASGYVKRRAAADGRAVALRLTRRGRAVAETTVDRRADVLLRLVGTLTGHERDALGKLAARLLDRGTPTPRAAGKTCRLCDYDACTMCPFREKFAI